MNENTDKVNRRHLLGFRRFQNAALRALSVALTGLNGKGKQEKDKAPVKVGDMKTLVSTYKEAVAGERMVLGMGSSASEDWPEEMVVRWVEEDEQLSEDGGLDIPGT